MRYFTLTGFAVLVVALCIFSADGKANCVDPSLCESPAPNMNASAYLPLTVHSGDHAVILIYEQWFGPNDAMSFYGSTEANPLLQSLDMAGFASCPIRGVKCGYDSIDPIVVSTHARWIEWLGADAVTLDDSNGDACIFDTQAFGVKHESGPGGCNADRVGYQQISANNAALYSAWSALGSKLKLIPMVEASEAIVFQPDDFDSNNPHKPAIQKAIEHYGRLMSQYPNMNVIYLDKPLILLYVGVAADATLPYIESFLHSKAGESLSKQYTFRIVGGFLESQSQYWAPADKQLHWQNKNSTRPSGPTLIDNKFGFWTGGDRFNTTCETADCKNHVCNDTAGCWKTYPFYPTYAMYDDNVEAFAVEVATSSASYSYQTQWGNPPRDYAPDASLRFDSEYNYVTLFKHLSLAEALKPAFLILSQFNEFHKPDEGWDSNTSDDTEPTDAWGYTGIKALHSFVERYRGAL